MTVTPETQREPIEIGDHRKSATGQPAIELPQLLLEPVAVVETPTVDTLGVEVNL